MPYSSRDDFKSRVLATWHPTVRSLAMAINLTSTAIILALAISGCSSTNYGAASLLADPSGDPTQEPPCGRLESAYYLSTVGFRATEYIAESCVSDPHLVNCNPANFVIGPIAGVVFAPMGFVIGFLSDTPRCGATAPVIAAGPTDGTIEEPKGGEFLAP